MKFKIKNFVREKQHFFGHLKKNFQTANTIIS